MKIVIKKRVNLDFLGDEYKDAYLVFKPITVGAEYDELSQKLDKLQTENNNTNLVKFIRDTVFDKFLEGKFPNDKGELEDVNKEDLGQLDFDTIANVFRRLSGQEPDPKV